MNSFYEDKIFFSLAEYYDFLILNHLDDYIWGGFDDDFVD